MVRAKPESRMKYLKKLDWDHIVVRMFYFMVTIIGLYVSSTLKDLTKSVGQLNVQMSSVLTQLANNTDTNKELKEHQNEEAKIVWDHEVRLRSIEQGRL